MEITDQKPRTTNSTTLEGIRQRIESGEFATGETARDSIQHPRSRDKRLRGFWDEQHDAACRRGKYMHPLRNYATGPSWQRARRDSA